MQAAANRTSSFAAAVVIALMATSAVGQERPTARGALAGVVRDTSGLPLSLVVVTVALDTPRVALTDTAGTFRLDHLPTGLHRVSFRRIGFVQAAFFLVVPPGDGPRVTVELVAAPLRLDTITVTDSLVDSDLEAVGFYERERQARVGAGVGRFVTPEEMDRLRTLPRATHVVGAAGVRLLQAEQGLTLWPVGRANMILRGVRGSIVMGPCQMAVFIDAIEVPIGTYYETGSGGGLDAYVHPSEIKAIEVYQSASGTPVQFQSTRNAMCGSIVIWTMPKKRTTGT